MLNETIIAVIGDHGGGYGNDHGGGYGNDHGVKPPSIADVYVPMLFRGIIFLATIRMITCYET